jgi:hypothetical protein
VTLQAAAWHTKPSYAIVTTQDCTIAPALLKWMYKVSTPLSGSPVVKHHVKHRSTENFSPVSNMWKQARASLWATALMAMMPFRLDLFR